MNKSNLKQLGMIATSSSWRRFWLNYRYLKYPFCESDGGKA